MTRKSAKKIWDHIATFKDRILLVCPFCGSQEEKKKPRLIWEQDKEYGISYNVHCEICLITLSPSWTTVEEAIDHWNRRYVTREYESNFQVFEACKDLIREFLDKIDVSHV